MSWWLDWQKTRGIEGNECSIDWQKTRGIEGNELVDRAAVEDGPVVCDRMPREVIITGEKEMDLCVERHWTDTGRGQ